MIDIMNWFDIIKIDRKEAQRLGDKYAPDEMKEFYLDKNLKRMKKIDDYVRENLYDEMEDYQQQYYDMFYEHTVKETDPEKFKNARLSLLSILRQFGYKLPRR